MVQDEDGQTNAEDYLHTLQCEDNDNEEIFITETPLSFGTHVTTLRRNV